LKIDGIQASPAVTSDLLEITVDHSLHLPSMFSIRLHCHEMVWLEDPTFREGKKIEIYFGNQPPVKLLSGKIAGLEPDLDESAPTLLVRGYDLAHQLYRGRHRRSFTQVTDSDLAKKLAMEVSLRPGTIDSTSEVYDYVFQYNQTNAEFLQERADNLGYELWVEDDALHFRKPSPQGTPIKLAWGDNLRRFRTRLSTTEQVNEVEVRGWDPKRKQEVVGHAQQGTGGPAIGVSQSGSDIAKQAWGEAKLAIIDQLVQSPGDADSLAQARLNEMTAGFVEAEGTCDANPSIVPGSQVQIEGVGSRFGGTYYITKVLHEWTTDEGLRTHFTASGRRDRSVWSLLEESAASSFSLGLVIGLVTNNKDPEEMGRVRVKFPWLSDQDESAWARVIAPMAGGDRGFFYLPEVDDEVVVGFDHGDIHRPFILGALWNGVDATPLKADAAVGGDGKVNKRVLKSRSGHTITLDDTDGDEEITIVDKTGSNKIVFHSPDNSLQIKVQGDLTIESEGKITMKGTNGIDVSSPNKLTLSGDAGAEMKTSSQLKLSGDAGAEMTTSAQLKLSGDAGAEMSTSAQLKLSGQAGAEVSSTAQLKLSGTAGAELSTPAQLAVKGTMIDVEGAGPVTVKGLPIQLN
jgi:phage protein D/phage baseplate assembly protein gpV